MEQNQKMKDIEKNIELKRLEYDLEKSDLTKDITVSAFLIAIVFSIFNIIDISKIPEITPLVIKIVLVVSVSCCLFRMMFGFNKIKKIASELTCLIEQKYK